MWITILIHAKCLFKMIFGHNYFISEPIFKLFVVLFRTHELQKDGINAVFERWCSDSSRSTTSEIHLEFSLTSLSTMIGLKPMHAVASH